MSRLLQAALDYAARGWLVLPLKPKAKAPATHRGLYDATGNPATLRRWFEKYPYNVGVRTGITGIVSSVFVLDIDGDDGATSLRGIERKHGSLPATLISTTGVGRHYWFRAEGPIPNSAGKIGAGLDIRGDGGYVVAPPSIHPNGKTYQWIDAAIPPAPAPHWLIELARARPASISQQAIANIIRPACAASGGIYGRIALDREIETLARAPKGSRNHALNIASFNLHQLVAGGELDGDEVKQRLLAAAHTNGLLSDPSDGIAKVKSTIRSGARAGLQTPRDRNGRR